MDDALTSLLADNVITKATLETVIDLQCRIIQKLEGISADELNKQIDEMQSKNHKKYVDLLKADFPKK